MLVYLGKVTLVHRGRGHSTVADDVGRSALTDSALCAAIDEKGKIRVCVDIHKSRRNKTAVDVDRFPALERARRSDPGDPSILNAEIAPEPGVATPIYDPAISEHNIVSHSLFSSSLTRLMNPESGCHNANTEGIWLEWQR